METRKGRVCVHLLLSVLLIVKWPVHVEGIARRRDSMSPLQTTPLMGWNPWNLYGCSANETVIRKSADALVDTGLAGMGYEWVHLDDCWMLSELDANGALQVNTTQYPSGMKALGDYIHSKGLKFGIYASSGNKTCQLRAGSLGHEWTHAQQFAEWGVDALKYDNCNPPPDQIMPQSRYAAMAAALANLSRPIYFNIANNGQYSTPTWASQYGSSWIISEDIEDSWPSILEIADLTSQWAPYSGPTLGWNDADMLEVGNGGLSFEEYKAHFSVWAMVKSPLYIGTSLVNMTEDTFTILSNKEVIAVNQDSEGAQATVRVHDDTELEVWAGPLSGGRTVVLLWNRASQPANITANWGDIGIGPSTRVIARDLWQHLYYPEYFTDSITLGPIPPHGVIMVRLDPNSDLPPPAPYVLATLPPPPGAASPVVAPSLAPTISLNTSSPPEGNLTTTANQSCGLTRDSTACLTTSSQSVPTSIAPTQSSGTCCAHIRTQHWLLYGFPLGGLLLSILLQLS